MTDRPDREPTRWSGTGICAQAAAVTSPSFLSPSPIPHEVPAVRGAKRELIAFLEFVGPSSETLRGEIMRLAAASFRIVSSARLDGLSVREFALDHALDVVVQGGITRREHGHAIRVRFLRGATGRLIASATASVRQPALDSEARERLQRALARTLSTIRR